jgi:hypothetical protein
MPQDAGGADRERGACVTLWLALGAIVLGVEVVAAGTGGKTRPSTDLFIF